VYHESLSSINERSRNLRVRGEFFAHNVLYSARARVPLVESRIKELMNGEFKTACAFPQELVISVPDKEWKPEDHVGAWLSVSADEYRFSWVGAIARDVRAGKDMTEWLKYMLTTRVTFSIHASELDRYYAATNIKEGFANTYSLTMITTYQRIIEICLYKEGRFRSVVSLISDAPLNHAFKET